MLGFQQSDHAGRRAEAEQLSFLPSGLIPHGNSDIPTFCSSCFQAADGRAATQSTFRPNRRIAGPEAERRVLCKQAGRSNNGLDR
ncbi:uncharacterized protein LY89DRAFT_194528 [Mollisia scopiformis]|uniref:Uncharacterized protein n=1 Tax=Mollisia scopiformis TaxID=149040 RepID=A0A194WY02_MOLSC|nr:uncharacterized protein LY89DRAFT_194528 [Mollisia scopiformis]KUJ12805.1 hypothetical protein LY89DRAFT_194528 [Mollisia scopiformis]